MKTPDSLTDRWTSMLLHTHINTHKDTDTDTVTVTAIDTVTDTVAYGVTNTIKFVSGSIYAVCIYTFFSLCRQFFSAFNHAPISSLRRV